MTTRSIIRDVDAHERQQVVEGGAIARLCNRIATLGRASVALATTSRGGGALGAFGDNQSASSYRKNNMLTLNGRGATSGGHRGKTAHHSFGIGLRAYDSSGHGKSKDRREPHYVLCVWGKEGSKQDKET